MQIDWWTLLLQAINVLVLVWLLSRFLFKPITNVIAERERSVSSALKQAQVEKEAAEIDRKNVAQALASIEEQREKTLRKTAEEVGSLLEQARKDVEQESQRVRDEAQAHVLRQQQAMHKQAQLSAIELTADYSQKVLQRLPGIHSVAGFIQGLIDGIEDLPEQTRLRLGQDNHSVKLTSATPLTHQERAACELRVQQALDHAVSLEWLVDPELIAGLELKGRHCIVNNNIKADIARLSSELKRVQ